VSESCSTRGTVCTYKQYRYCTGERYCVWTYRQDKIKQLRTGLFAYEYERKVDNPLIRVLETGAKIFALLAS
jgi:hypothetical protein